MEANNSTQENRSIDIDSLKKIAIFLEGVKQGRGGDIRPLGIYDLDQLWEVIEFFQEKGSVKIK